MGEKKAVTRAGICRGSKVRKEEKISCKGAPGALTQSFLSAPTSASRASSPDSTTGRMDSARASRRPSDSTPPSARAKVAPRSRRSQAKRNRPEAEDGAAPSPPRNESPRRKEAASCTGRPNAALKVSQAWRDALKVDEAGIIWQQGRVEKTERNR